MGARLQAAFAPETTNAIVVDGTIAAIDLALDELTAAGRPVRAIIHTLSLDHPAVG